MKKCCLLLIAVLAGAAGCATGALAPAASSEPKLSATGFGSLTFGDTLAETEKKVGESARGVDGNARCGYVEFASLPGLRLTVKEGIVIRADAGQGVRNSLGVNLGDTVDSVVYLYPNVRTLRLPNTFGDSLMVFDDPGGKNAIVLHAAGNKIIGIWAGLNSALGSTKGCP